MKRGALALAALVAVQCYLDDRPSQRVAEEVYQRIRPGMTPAEVVQLVEPPAQAGEWELGASGCRAGPAASFVVKHSPEDGAYVIESFAHRADQTPASRRVYRNRDLLLQAVAQGDLAACRDFELGFGPWSLRFRMDGSGRVTEVSRPVFSD